jgi:hypothetical protein
LRLAVPVTDMVEEEAYTRWGYRREGDNLGDPG